MLCANLWHSSKLEINARCELILVCLLGMCPQCLGAVGPVEIRRYHKNCDAEHSWKKWETDSVVKIRGFIIWIHPEAANALTFASQHLFC